MAKLRSEDIAEAMVLDHLLATAESDLSDTYRIIRLRFKLNSLATREHTRAEIDEVFREIKNALADLKFANASRNDYPTRD